MGLRGALALAAGGFREDLGWGKRSIPGEEADLAHRMLEQNEKARMVYAPAATVDHWIDPSRLSEEYFRRWYRGHGRASVLIHPSEDVPARIVRIAAQARRVLKWRARTLRASDPRAEILRKRSKAEGKLLQLLGL
jgi:hypothetical protein